MKARRGDKEEHAADIDEDAGSWRCPFSDERRIRMTASAVDLGFQRSSTRNGDEVRATSCCTSNYVAF
jgi:hypothetical protein